MQETLVTMMTSRRSKSDRVADRRMRSISSLIGRFLLDVRVGGGDVGFGLVVVVVADEVLDRILGKEAPELLVQLGGQRLVVHHDQGRPVHLRNGVRHREGLARSGHAEQHLAAVAPVEALRELANRTRLVACEREVGYEVEAVVDRGHTKRSSYY